MYADRRIVLFYFSVPIEVNKCRCNLLYVLYLFVPGSPCGRVPEELWRRCDTFAKFQSGSPGRPPSPVCRKSARMGEGAGGAIGDNHSVSPPHWDPADALKSECLYIVHPESLNLVLRFRY